MCRVISDKLFSLAEDLDNLAVCLDENNNIVRACL